MCSQDVLLPIKGNLCRMDLGGSRQFISPLIAKMLGWFNQSHREYSAMRIIETKMGF
jgi:hypothetical protein